MKLLFKILFFCFFTASLLAQGDKNLKNADKKFNNFAYVEAREIYLDVAKSGYKSENLFKKLGDSYYFNNELSKSLEWYEKLYYYQKNVDPIYLFRYSMALKSVKKYAEADKILEEYNRSIPQDQASIETQSVEELMNLNSNKYTITKANINSAFSDYAPTYYLSKIVFVSNRKTKEKKPQENHKWNNQPFSDLYAVNLKRGNIIEDKAEPFDETLNSTLHESSAVFTKDGKTIYFSRNNYNENKYKTNSKGVNLVKIYKSTKGEGDKWQTPVELSFNSDEYSCAHPALSLDEKKLYFSSDMPGTYGMSDIYEVEIYPDGSYGTPHNLGNKINTAGRESYPFINKKNQFFFASDGHPGLGGFDLFATELKKDNSVSEIMNLGSPLNGSTDDISLILDSADNTGFYASNRDDGSGSDDIYSFILKEDIISSCRQHVTGNVINEKTGYPLSGLSVKVFDLEMNLVTTTTTDEKGDYKLYLECNKKFIIRISGDNIPTTEKIITTDGTFEKKIDLPFSIKEGDDLRKTKTNYGDDIGKILQLDPIYFDFDRDNIRPDAEVELQKVISFLKRNSKTYLDIRSHTDSQGERAYNIALSERRAKATIDYIVKHGIKADRLSGRGYGDTRLMNGCSHNVVCSEAQHQLNRRSEFILFDKKNASNDKVSQNDNFINVDTSVKNSAINQKVSTTISTTQPVPTQTKAVETSKIEVPVVKVNPISTKVNDAVKFETTETTKKSGGERKTYDFLSKEPVYTVQILSVKEVNNISFANTPNVFKHKYQDGTTKFYSGVFSTLEEALQHRDEINKKEGMGSAFVIQLKGEERIKAQ